MIACEQDRGAASDAEDEHTRPLDQVIGQSLGCEIEKGDRFALAFVAGDYRHGGAIGEDRQLLRRRCGAVETEAGYVAEGNCRASHHTDKAERARALMDHFGARRVECDAQPLVFGEARRNPRFRRECGQCHACRCQRQRATSLRAAGGADAGDGRGHKTKREDRPQTLGRRQHKQGRDHRCCADACADEVEPIDPPDAFAEAHESQADAIGGAEKRNRQYQVRHSYVKELARPPHEFERVERETLHEGEPDKRGNPEKGRIDLPCRHEAPEQEAARERDEGAAKAVAQQGNADDHEGEMLPLHNRVQTYQQHFVGDGSARNESYCNERHSIPLAGKRHETHRQQLPRLHAAIFVLGDEEQLLNQERASHRDHHPAPRLELSNQLRRNVGGRRGDDDAVERGVFEPTEIAVADAGGDVEIAKPFQPVARLPGRVRARFRCCRPACPARRERQPDNPTRCLSRARRRRDRRPTARTLAPR